MNARMKDALDEALILSDKCDTLFRSVCLYSSFL